MTTDDLKKVAQAMLDMLDIHEASYVSKTILLYNVPTEVGDYSKSMEDAAQEAETKHELPEGFWFLMYLASKWGNDIDDWSKTILSGKPVSNMFTDIDETDL